jgi:hypothetical protein
MSLSLYRVGAAVERGLLRAANNKSRETLPSVSQDFTVITLRADCDGYRTQHHGESWLFGVRFLVVRVALH